ncbi:MAG: PEGA domain-containing protein [Kofleriaceae bacterium]
MAGHKTKGLRIATRCTTLDQFVAAFHRFCDAQTVFISTLNPRSVGLETAFSIDLADHTPALRGVGVVLQAWTTPQNPFGRPGLQLGIRRLTADSEPMFDRLLFAREATAATPTATAKMMPVIVARPGVKRPLAPTVQVPLGAPKPASVPPAEVPPEPAIAVADGERAAGSDLVLPANPLMNIDDKSLEGFVDCTLYEETGNFFPEQPTIEDPDDPVVAPPLLAPRRATTPPRPAMIVSPKPEPEIPSIPPLRAAPIAQAFGTHPEPVINKLTPPMGASAFTQPGQFTLPMFGPVALANRTVPIQTSALAQDIAERMQLPLQTPGPPPIPTRPWISPETAELLEVEPDPPSLDALELAPHANLPAPALAPSGAYPAYAAAQRTRRNWVIGGATAATLTIAIAILSAGHSAPAKSVDPTPPQVPKLLASNTRQPRAIPPPIDQKPVVDSVTAETDPPDEIGTGAVVGKGPCKVAISTTPAGSMITLDGQPVGPSPLTVAGPCTKRRVDVVHPRYAPAERWTAAKPDDTLDITLMRPTHNLFVETQPAGATVSIDGHRAGTSPTVVKVMGFTTLTLQISKPGWKPTTRKLYSKAAVDRLAVKLTR